MKLRTKLIPLAALAATSIVTPLVTMTSCSNEKTYSFDLVNQKFEYKKGMSKIKASNIIDATTEYVKAITKDPEIFVYDYVNYLYEISKSGIEAEEISKLNISITSPKINHTKVVYPGEQSMTYPTISFTLKFDMEGVEEDSTKTNEQIIGSITYQNVPFAAYDSKLVTWEEALPITKKNADNGWCVGVTGVMKKYGYIFDYMNEPWSIKGNIDTKSTITYSTIEGKTNTKTNHYSIDCTRPSDLADLFNKLGDVRGVGYFFMDFESTYLSEVEILPEIECIGDGLTAAIHEDDTVSIHGLKFSGTWTGASFTYEVNDKIEALASSESDTSFIGSKLIIQKGAQLNIDTSDNTITIDSSANGKVYIEPKKGGTIVKSQTGKFIFPKTISLLNTATKVVSVIASNTDYVETESPATLTVPTTPETVNYTANWGYVAGEGIKLKCTLTGIQWSLGYSDLTIKSFNLKAISNESPQTTIQFTNATKKQSGNFGVDIEISASGTVPASNSVIYTFTDDSEIVFESNKTTKTYNVSLKDWQMKYEVGGVSPGEAGE